MKKTFKLMLAATAAAALVACGGGGGGGDAPPMENVATSDLFTKLTESKIGAIAGEEFNFPNGVPSFGVNSSTFVTLVSVNQFKVRTPSGRAAEGALSVGDGLCTFKSATSTYSGTPLDQDAAGVTVSCNLYVATDGTNAQGIAVPRPVTLVLGGTSSTPKPLETQVMPDGKVFVKKVYVGDVPVGARFVTGASGATGGFF